MNPMNWKECVKIFEEAGIRTRFEWPAQEYGGFNCHYDITISEVWGAIAWVWTWPGDWILRTQYINNFFELEPLVTGHWFSVAFPVIVLFFVAVQDSAR